MRMLIAISLVALGLAACTVTASQHTEYSSPHSNRGQGL